MVDFITEVDQIDVYFNTVYPPGIFDIYVNKNMLLFVEKGIAYDYYKCVLGTDIMRFPTLAKVNYNFNIEDAGTENYKNVVNNFWGFGYKWLGETINEGIVFSDVYKNGEPRMFYKNFYNSNYYTASTKNKFWLNCSFLLNEINDPLSFSDYYIRKKSKGVLDKATQMAYSAYFSLYIDDVQTNYGTDIKSLAFRRYYNNLQFVIESEMLPTQTMTFFSKFYIDFMTRMKYNFFFLDNPLKVGFKSLIKEGYLLNSDLKKENGLYFFLNNAFLFSNMYENIKITNYVWEILTIIYGDVNVSELYYLGEVKKELNGVNRFLTSMTGHVPEYSYTLSYFAEKDKGMYENFLEMEEVLQRLRSSKKDLGVDLRRYMGNLGIEIKPRMEFLDKIFLFIEEYNKMLVLEKEEQKKIEELKETFHYLVMRQPGGTPYDLYYEFTELLEKDFIDTKINSNNIFRRWGKEEADGWKWEPSFINLFEYLDADYRDLSFVEGKVKFYGYPVTVINFSVLEDISFLIKGENFVFYDELDFSEISSLSKKDFRRIGENFLIKDFVSAGRNTIGEVEIEMKIRSFIDNSVPYFQESWKNPVDLQITEVETVFYGLPEVYKKIFWDVESEYGLAYDNGIIISNLYKFRDYREGVSALKFNFFDIIRKHNEVFLEFTGRPRENVNFLESMTNLTKSSSVSNQAFAYYLQRCLKEDTLETIESLAEVASVNYNNSILYSIVEEIVEEILKEKLQENLGESKNIAGFMKHMGVEEIIHFLKTMPYEEKIARNFYNNLLNYQKINAELDMAVYKRAIEDVPIPLAIDSLDLAVREIDFIINRTFLDTYNVEFVKKEKLMDLVFREFEKKLSIFGEYLEEEKSRRVYFENLRYRRAQILSLEEQFEDYGDFVRRAILELNNYSRINRKEALAGCLLYMTESNNWLNEPMLYFRNVGKSLNEAQFNSLCNLYEAFSLNDNTEGLKYLVEKCPEIVEFNFQFPQKETGIVEFIDQQNLNKLRQIFEVIMETGNLNQKEEFAGIVLEYYEKKGYLSELSRRINGGELNFKPKRIEILMKEINERLLLRKNEELPDEKVLSLRAKNIVEYLNKLWDENKSNVEFMPLDISPLLEEIIYKHSFVEGADSVGYQLFSEKEYMKRFIKEIVPGLEGKSEDLEAELNEQLIALGILDRY